MPRLISGAQRAQHRVERRRILCKRQDDLVLTRLDLLHSSKRGTYRAQRCDRMWDRHAQRVADRYRRSCVVSDVHAWLLNAQGNLAVRRSDGAGRGRKSLDLYVCDGNVQWWTSEPAVRAAVRAEVAQV